MRAPSSAPSEMALMMRKGIRFWKQTWAMAAPSISQQVPLKVFMSQSFCFSEDMKISPERTVPESRCISGISAAAASSARVLRLSDAWNLSPSKPSLTSMSGMTPGV